MNVGSVQGNQRHPGGHEVGGRSARRNCRYSVPSRTRTVALLSVSDRTVVQWHQEPSLRHFGTRLSQRKGHSLNDQFGIMGAARRNEQLGPVGSLCSDSWRNNAQAIRASAASAILFFMAISSSISRRARCLTVGLSTSAGISQLYHSGSKRKKKELTRLYH